MSDYEDLVRLAKTYVAMQRCPGGRLVHADYLCLHCGLDNSVGFQCGAPTKEAKKRMVRDAKTKTWTPVREWEP